MVTPMPDLDLVVRNGTVVTASDSASCDVGVRDGRIAAVAERLPAAAREIDAQGRLVLPGGVDSHCHIEQLSGMGIWNADDFYSGTVSAAWGGTTTVIPFAAQHRGQSMLEVVAAYRERAKKAVIDHAFHMIVSDPSEQVMGELPGLIGDGFSSLKLFMTYPLLKLADEQMLTLLALARRERAMVSVHAENDAMIGWMVQRLLARGHTAPRYHAVSHPRLAEAEAVNRLIAMAALVDQPVVVFHVTTEGSMAAIRDAQTRGQKVFAETCPQYLFLSADHLDRGLEGAKWMFSPPARDAADQAAMWRGVANGTFQIVSSDHAPYRFDETGKLAHGPESHFKQIANGIPGIELRLPLLFSEGVKRGRIDLHRFVELCCTNPARIYGLHPRKGSIAVGADADLAIWDPDRKVSVEDATPHDATGYCPYAGMTLTGWPVTVIARGEVIVDNGKLHAERGRGRLLTRAAGPAAAPSGALAPELDPRRNFGADLLD
ncbi:MAG TPA: dihydropyrimidinase [Geminicoccaceae bacterium]|nr:dihydropyrimidinase [Geminicoccaceae bacterium]